MSDNTSLEQELVTSLIKDRRSDRRQPGAEIFAPMAGNSDDPLARETAQQGVEPGVRLRLDEEAEVAAGRRLVQVGFMRRFDPAYVEMKRAKDSGEIGESVLLHNQHRNAAGHP